MTEYMATALVTGASSGIGAAYAGRLAARGHDLVLVARDAARLEALAARLRQETGRAVEVLPADLADRDQLALVGARLASDPAIGLLVNNAGISLSRTMLEEDAGAVERLLAVNVVAATLLAQAGARAFLARGRGALVTIGSVLAVAPELFDPAYAATKAHLLALSQGLAARLEGSGVRVQLVMPGMTRTEIWERSGKDPDALPPDMVMTVDDLVDAALVGFDRGETVTIPPLADDADWQALEAARRRLAPQLSRRDPAPRYRA
jgi:uncharacterized protein